jgi:hypothetical protein
MKLSNVEGFRVDSNNANTSGNQLARGFCWSTATTTSPSETTPLASASDTDVVMFGLKDPGREFTTTTGRSIFCPISGRAASFEHLSRALPLGGPSPVRKRSGFERLRTKSEKWEVKAVVRRKHQSNRDLRSEMTATTGCLGVER